MFSKLLTILSFFLAIAIAAPTSETGQLAKREVDVVSGLNDLLSSLNGLSSTAQSNKYTSSSVSDDFTNAASSAASKAADFANSLKGADLSGLDMNSVLPIGSSIINVIIEFFLNLVQWVLRLGIQFPVHALQDCFNLCVSLCDALTTIVGGNSSLTDPIANALGVVQNAGSFFGL